MNLEFDVVIVGYGPVGQCLAAMLGQAGFRVGVFERWPSLYPLPRACVVDHEVMRVLQSIGVAEPFSKLAVPTNGEYVWLNASGQTLYHFKYEREGISGWPARNLMYQPDLEAQLDKRVRELPSVEVNQGWEAVACTDGPDGVEIVVAPCTVTSSGAIERGAGTRRVQARFVVGADGANSFVRRAAQLPWDDLGFRADWLVVDYRPHHPERELDMPEAGQICDPARPITLMRHMGKKHVRWEMMLLPGETAQEITRPEKVWSMINRWVKPEDGVIDRAAVYTFRSGVAQRWFRGHVLLAGDAAHLMPPFLGQGLCSGMRDALALYWRLQLVLRGIAPASIFQGYELERKEHVTAVIERAVALGRVVCITDPEEAALRDAAIFSGSAPPVPAFPSLTCGLLQRGGHGAVEPPAGQLSLQAPVQARGLRVRLQFDDVVGAGWRILTYDASIEQCMTREIRTFLESIDAKVVNFNGGEVIDCEGAYREYLNGLDAAAVIVRPDFYIYGVARRAIDVPRLLADLQQGLAGRALAAH